VLLSKGSAETDCERRPLGYSMSVRKRAMRAVLLLPHDMMESENPSPHVLAAFLVLLKWYYDQKIISFFSPDSESVFAFKSLKARNPRAAY